MNIPFLPVVVLYFPDCLSNYLAPLMIFEEIVASYKSMTDSKKHENISPRMMIEITLIGVRGLSSPSHFVLEMRLITSIPEETFPKTGC
jgi:hypothetical protein